MLFTLHIIKLEPGQYRAHVMEGHAHLGDCEADSISAAIQLMAENPLPETAGFHIWYEGVCAGTTPVADMRSDPKGLAERLVALHSRFRA